MCPCKLSQNSKSGNTIIAALIILLAKWGWELGFSLKISDFWNHIPGWQVKRNIYPCKQIFCMHRNRRLGLEKNNNLFSCESCGLNQLLFLLTFIIAFFDLVFFCYLLWIRNVVQLRRTQRDWKKPTKSPGNIMKVPTDQRYFFYLCSFMHMFGS